MSPPQCLSMSHASPSIFWRRRNSHDIPNMEINSAKDLLSNFLLLSVTIKPKISHPISPKPTVKIVRNVYYWFALHWNEIRVSCKRRKLNNFLIVNWRVRNRIYIEPRFEVSRRFYVWLRNVSILSLLIFASSSCHMHTHYHQYSRVILSRDQRSPNAMVWLIFTFKEEFQLFSLISLL